jgi:enoyl-CoA hydratase/carnithine racemase
VTEASVDRGVRVERRRDVLIATIDRPHRRNAADLDVYHALEDVVRDGRAAACVLGGGGTDFSAGDDVAIFDFADVDAADAFIVEVTRLFQEVEAAPRPVVAAVDGYALGFGFELALACDLVVATPEAVLGLPEIVHGAAPPNAIGRAPGVLGRGLTRELALRGRHWLSGVEAHRYGLVCELHPPDRLLDAAVSLAEEAAGTPEFVATKRLLSLDAERAYRLAPLIMPQLMASQRIAESRARYARG